MNDREVSTLVTGRSRRFVRQSVLVLTLVLMLAASVLAFALDRQQSLREDFADNDRLHLVEVTSRLVDGNLAPLSTATAQDVTAALGQDAPGRPFDLVERFELGAALVGDGSRSLTVYGVGGTPEQAGLLVGLDRVEPGVGYMVDGQTAPELLEVPVVDVRDGGYDSSSLVDAGLRLSPDLDPDRAMFLFGPLADTVIVVDRATFRELASLMFGETYESVVARYERGELSLTPLVSAAYVQVAALDDVDAVAGALLARQYNVAYALQAFDELSASLRSQNVLLLALVAVTLLGAVLLLAISWNSYFRLSRRDMGMLRHFGFSQLRVRRVYARRVAQGCRTAMAVSAVYGLVLAIVLLGPESFPQGLLVAAVIVVVVLLVQGALVRVVLDRHVRVDTMTLLKLDRQFQ